MHNPAWSRDERFLYFQAEEGGIYRVQMSDRGVARVTGLENIGAWKDSFCFFEGLALDDSPLVSCRQSDRDLYAFDGRRGDVGPRPCRAASASASSIMLSRRSTT